jgi:uncharacterized protein YlaI
MGDKSGFITKEVRDMCQPKWAVAVLLVQVLLGSARADDSRVLFNGKDLDGWAVEGPKEYKNKSGKVVPMWSVHDGVLRCAGQGFGFLRYEKQQFADFAWHVEYRMAPNGNSGLGIRTIPFNPAKSRATRPSYACYEVQLLDDAGKPATKYSSGSLYRYVAPRANAVKPAGEWNSVDVECVGPRIRVTINGQEVLDVDQSKIVELKNKPLKGYVCLQSHTNRVEFRNIRIREIKTTAGR